MAAGALFNVIAAMGSAGVAISLYAVLSKTHTGLALAAVAFRGLEAAMYLAAVISLLSLVTVSQQFTTAGPADRASLQAIGDSLVSLHDHAALLGVFAFCAGAFSYYYLFFRSRLIPRWLSGWGMAAIISMLAACVLALFNDRSVSGYVPLAIPIGVQEMVLAVWLIARGFSASPVPSET